MSNKRLMEAIIYTEDVEPYSFTQIYAGVGSGKNYFAEQLMKGYDEELKDGTVKHIDAKTVLLITSRRAKVEEILTEEDLPVKGRVGRWDEHHHVIDDNGDEVIPTGRLRRIETEWGTSGVYQDSVVCTNAFIEKYLQYRYDPQDPTTHLWELFDIIFIDEVHSAIVDATYQSAPFHVQDLVNEYLRRVRRAEKNPAKYNRPLCKNLIMMTGTPETIRDLNTGKDCHVLDMMKKCKNVVPKNIFFVSTEDAWRQMEYQLSWGEKIVYFTNHVIFPEIYCESLGLAREATAVSFSKEEKRIALRESCEADYNRMVSTEQYLAKNSKLPEDVQLFMTTSRNKEGVNIENKDIKHLYVESHVRSDVVQMAGRIRDGVENMYIVIDSIGHGSPEWEREAEFTEMMIASYAQRKSEICGVTNEYLEYLCKELNIEGMYAAGFRATTTISKTGEERLSKYIEYVESKFPYVRYSYLKNAFQYYNFRKLGKEYQRANYRLFNEGKDNPSRYAEIVKEWFPASSVYHYVTPSERAWQYFQTEVLSKKESYIDEEVSNILDDLNRIFCSNITQINSLLKKFCNYKCQRRSNTKKHPGYKERVFKNIGGDDFNETL